MSDNFFSDEVCKHLAAYVYGLRIKGESDFFYIGKGRGNRVFHHANEARCAVNNENEILNPKLKLIRELHKSGREVECVIFRHGMTDEVAFHVESTLIDAFSASGLLNKQREHYAPDFGISSIAEIQNRYNLPECYLIPDDKVLLIKIPKLNGSRDQNKIFDLVRFCWKIDVRRARRADYILALEKGIVVGAFTANKWLSATLENFSKDFPDIDNSEERRYGFHGGPAPDEIQRHYVGQNGKRLSGFNFKSQSPIRYSYK